MNVTSDEISALVLQRVRMFVGVVALVCLPVQFAGASPLVWSTQSEVMAGGTKAVSAPKIAIDPNGNVMAVWVQSDGIAQSIYAKQHSLSDGLPGVLLEASDMPADNPQVAADGKGNFIAVWRQAWKTVNGERFGIYASRYDGQTWGAPAVLYVDTSREDVTADADIQLAVDPNGNATATWSVYDWSWNHLSVRANRYVVGTGWTGVVNLSTEAVKQAYSADVAMDTAGNTIVVWHQKYDSAAGVVAVRYSAGSGWGTPMLIGPDVSQFDGEAPQIAFDASGNAIAIWTDYGKPGARTTRWTAASGWGTVTTLATPGTSQYDEGVRLAFDKNGNAMAVWNEYGEALFANRYVSGTGWGTTVVVASNGMDAFYSGQVAFDQNGNAVALFGNYSCNSYNIEASRYVPAAGWDPVRKCWESNFSVNTTLDNASDPQLVIDGKGKATAVWMQSGSAFMSTADILTVPGAPTNMQITAGPGRVTITLQPPSNTGYGAILSYTATCTASGRPNATASSPTTTIVVPGLVPGVSYACTATASNGSFVSPATSATSAIANPKTDLTPILMLLLD